MTETHWNYFQKFGMGTTLTVHSNSIPHDGQCVVVGENAVYFMKNKNGMYHRDNGPAVIYATGVKVWYKHGNGHRIDGPAIESPQYKNLWYINGINVDDKIRSWANDQGIDLDNLSDGDKSLINLAWSDHVRDV